MKTLLAFLTLFLIGCGDSATAAKGDAPATPPPPTPSPALPPNNGG